MAARIEDYALIGNLETAALVALDGSIDWLCLPRFDSDACFAALLGGRGNGRWQLSPTAEVTAKSRRYVGDSLVLETQLLTASGTVRITDCMPIGESPRILRVVECTSGEVELETRMSARFGYGDRRPWARTEPTHVEVTSAPDGLSLWSEQTLAVEAGDAIGRFVLRAGESTTFTLAWHPAHVEPTAIGDARALTAHTTAWWHAWAARCTYTGEWRDIVVRSLITLKALTYAPTGGIVAAPTTSLPEHVGGVRNWDYRFCWLRDASLTLAALLDSGYVEETHAFARWLERTGRGAPAGLRIMYTVMGDPRIPELELPWLAGYENSQPVRVGNAAAEQLQLDVYGELIDCFHHARAHGVRFGPVMWAFQREIVEHLETIWHKPDRGIWEIRGDELHFTFSKIMVWVAFDRMIKDAEAHELDGPIEHWRLMRDRVHEDICAHGFDAAQNAFTQAYGTPGLDASLLLVSAIGFLPADDPRVVGTVAAIRAKLLRDGLVLRYDTDKGVDGLPPGEGVFLPCSFWLADALHLGGDRQGAKIYFQRLVGLANDVGLISEQYDPLLGRLVGNFPQAFSHFALVRTALLLGR